MVYDAYGPDGTRVAVKVLHGARQSPGEPARMAVEVRAAQRVASFRTARMPEARLEPPRPALGRPVRAVSRRTGSEHVPGGGPGGGRR
ncbi:hypothetical protein Acsp03_40160 [Actinomadura sp. NBRC 104412]|nr:hypothetical protein Acsp03_40160 [Actinomadura sp. NBRC 104412]